MPDRQLHRAKVALLWIPAVAWMGAIFVVSSLPGSRIPGGYATPGHFLAYAVLGGLLIAPLWQIRGGGYAVAVAVLIASAYGVTDELHQAFVPLRTPDVADWGVDTLGALFGAWLVVWSATRLRRAVESRRPQ